MLADPGQTQPINEQEPAIATELAAAVKSWRGEILGSKDEFQSSGARQKRKVQSVDPRPFTVGFPEFPVTMLPARDGEPKGGVRRSSRAPNCSYFINWTSLDDRIVWQIDVHTPGQYEVTIDYTCKLPDAGSTIELSFLDASLTGKVMPGWDPPLYTNQDTLPRPPAESQMKEFRTLRFGSVDLPSGAGPLTLRALKIPGDSVMDLRRITLTLSP